jgi:hypothetical protein
MIYRELVLYLNIIEATDFLTTKPLTQTDKAKKANLVRLYPLMVDLQTSTLESLHTLGGSPTDLLVKNVSCSESKIAEIKQAIEPYLKTGLAQLQDRKLVQV